ncbi:MAG TPA: hypothetical protein VM901_13330 [Bdellovibrionota bacterium]|jgi:hypothetical protein|nr:hypothetical protein [Bdellovibrionota bacterium]
MKTYRLAWLLTIPLASSAHAISLAKITAFCLEKIGLVGKAGLVEPRVSASSLHLPEGFAVLPKTSSGVPHPTIEGGTVYRLTPSEVDKLTPGTKLVNSVTGRELILGIDPMNFSRIDGEGRSQYGLSTTTEAQDLIGARRVMRLHHNGRPGEGGLVKNQLHDYSRLQGLSDEAKYHYDLLHNHSASDAAYTTKLEGLPGQLNIPLSSGPVRSGDVFVKNASTPAYRRALHAFATANGIEVYYQNIHTFAKFPTESEDQIRSNFMYLKLKSPDEIAKFLRYQVEIAGGEEKLLDGQQRTGRMYMQEN